MPRSKPPYYPNSISPHGLIREINALQDMWQLGCLPSPEIWLKTLLPAVKMLLLGLFTLGNWDYLEIALGRAHRQGTNILRPVAQKIAPSLVEAADEIAADTWLFKIAAPIETALFAFMAVELTTDFLYNWESQAMTLAGCNPLDLQISAQYENLFYIPTPGWDLAIITTYQGDDVLNGVNGFIIPQGYSGSVGFASNVPNTTGENITVQHQLTDAGDGSTVYQSPVTVITPGNSYGGGDFRRRFLGSSGGAKKYFWEFKIGGPPIPMQLHLQASASAELFG